MTPDLDELARLADAVAEAEAAEDHAWRVHRDAMVTTEAARARWHEAFARYRQWAAGPLAP